MQPEEEHHHAGARRICNQVKQIAATAGHEPLMELIHRPVQDDDQNRDAVTVARETGKALLVPEGQEHQEGKESENNGMDDFVKPENPKIGEQIRGDRGQHEDEDCPKDRGHLIPEKTFGHLTPALL